MIAPALAFSLLIVPLVLVVVALIRSGWGNGPGAA